MDKEYLDMQIMNAIEAVEKENAVSSDKSVVIDNVKEILKTEGLK